MRSKIHNSIMLSSPPLRVRPLLIVPIIIIMHIPPPFVFDDQTGICIHGNNNSAAVFITFHRWFTHNGELARQKGRRTFKCRWHVCRCQTWQIYYLCPMPPRHICVRAICAYGRIGGANIKLGFYCMHAHCTHMHPDRVTQSAAH